MDGIGKVRTAVIARTPVVVYDPERIRPEAIREAIAALGMTLNEGRPV